MLASHEGVPQAPNTSAPRKFPFGELTLEAEVDQRLWFWIRDDAAPAPAIAMSGGGRAPGWDSQSPRDATWERPGVLLSTPQCPSQPSAPTERDLDHSVSTAGPQRLALDPPVASLTSAGPTTFLKTQTPLGFHVPPLIPSFSMSESFLVLSILSIYQFFLVF